MHVKTEIPKTRAGVENGYPRFHVDVRDPATGIVHEWQIGTKQTTELFEKPGIDVGNLDIPPQSRNIHDIEYDIFKALDEPKQKEVNGELVPSAQTVAEFRQLADAVGIPEFREQVARAAAETGSKRIPDGKLDREIARLHDQASEILRQLVARKGAPFVEAFLH